MSADLTLTNFWSHAIAAALFASLIVWRLKIGVRYPAQRLMIAGAGGLIWVSIGAYIMRQMINFEI